LNLAARLVDGEKVFVVRRGELVPVDVGGGGPVGDVGLGAVSGAGAVPTGPPEPIDLNAADLAALDSLPGVGPATARAILEDRAGPNSARCWPPPPSSSAPGRVSTWRRSPADPPPATVSQARRWSARRSRP